MMKVDNISKNIVKIFFAIFIVLYLLSNVLFTIRMNELESNTVFYDFGISVFTMLALISIIFVIFLIVKNKRRINNKVLLITFFVISTIIGLFWIFNNDIELRELDDAYNVMRSAKSIYNGNYDVLGFHTYLSNYPNNFGILTYDLIHLKLFGEIGALYSIRIVNLIFVLIGYYFLFKITDLLFQDNLANTLLIILMFLSMQFVFYAFFVYGNCISYSLAIVSVYLLLKYLKTNMYRFLFLSSVLIIGSISIKMNSIIVMIAEIIFIIINVLDRKKLIPLLAVCIMLSGMYIGTTGLQKFWGNKVDIDYSKTKLPTICWIAYGLNYDSRNPGHYTNEFEVYHYDHDFVQEYTALEAKRFINGSLEAFKKRPSLAIKFYCEKFLVSWANPQYETFDQYRELNNSELSESFISGNINKVLDCIWDATQILVAISLVAYIIVRHKTIELNELVCAVVVIGGWLFHSFWEVKAIYLYQYYMYLLPYAAYGLSKIKKQH